MNYRADGYKTGQQWDANWMPGGPFVLRDNEQSKKNNEDWLSGFADGLNARIAEDADFAAFWNESGGKMPRKRYRLTLEAVNE